MLFVDKVQFDFKQTKPIWQAGFDEQAVGRPFESGGKRRFSDGGLHRLARGFSFINQNGSKRVLMTSPGSRNS